MANRRMFSKGTISSDRFLSCKFSSQALYIQLCMNADDDGFVSNPIMIMRMCGAKDSDLSELKKKNFVIQFLSGVIVISEWRLNNTIKKDRYQETQYIKEKELLKLCDNNCYELKTKDDIQKIIDEPKSAESKIVDYEQVKEMYNNICTCLPKANKFTPSRSKAVKSVLKMYSFEDIQKCFEIANNNDFLIGNNEKNWHADFDWLLKIGNFTKVIEGNYTRNVVRSREDIELESKGMVLL